MRFNHRGASDCVKRSLCLGGVFILITLCYPAAGGPKNTSISKDIESLLNAMGEVQPGTASAFMLVKGFKGWCGPYQGHWPVVTGYPLETSASLLHTDADIIRHALTKEEMKQVLSVLRAAFGLESDIMIEGLAHYLSVLGEIEFDFEDLIKLSEAVGIDVDKESGRSVINQLTEMGLFTQEEAQALFAMFEEHGLFVDDTARGLFMKAKEMGLYAKISASNLFLFMRNHNLDFEMVSKYLDLKAIYQHLEMLESSVGLTADDISMAASTQVHESTMDRVISEQQLDLAFTEYKPTLSWYIGPDIRFARRNIHVDFVDVRAESDLRITDIVFFVFPPDGWQLKPQKVRSKTGWGEIREWHGQSYGVLHMPVRSAVDCRFQRTLPWSYIKPQ